MKGDDSQGHPEGKTVVYILDRYWANTQHLNPFPLAIVSTHRKLLSASGFGHAMEEVTGTEECAPGRANKQRCANLLKITQELQLLEGNTDTGLFTSIYHN